MIFHPTPRLAVNLSGCLILPRTDQPAASIMSPNERPTLPRPKMKITSGL